MVTEKEWTVKELIDLYRQWSDEKWCAGFMSPYPDTVRDFRTWLHSPDFQESVVSIITEYEFEMLEEFRKQEREDQLYTRSRDTEGAG